VKAFARLLRRGGFLVVLDYLPHQDERLRTEGGDAWLGFQPEEVSRFFAEASLTPVADAPLPSTFHPGGPDARLAWHAWAARRPGGASEPSLAPLKP
jgi:ArsR family transcriptional regulator